MKLTRQTTKAVRDAAEFIEKAKAFKAKIGELLPAQQGKRTDKLLPVDGKSSLFDKNTVTAYRKIAANKDKIGEVLPAEKGGRGKKADKPLVEFSLPTIAAYRKIAANKETDSEAPPPLVLGSFWHF